MAEVVLARVVEAVFNVGVVMAEVVLARVVMAVVVMAVVARGAKQRVRSSRGAEWHRRHPPPAGRPRTRPQAPRKSDPKNPIFFPTHPKVRGEPT